MNENKGTNTELEQLFTHPEPWEAWENKLVVWSIVAAILALAVLGVIINVFILD